MLIFQQITELKKENFNLKLRIYFLEERMQQEFDGPIEHICKTVSVRPTPALQSLVSLPMLIPSGIDSDLLSALARRDRAAL